jgi:hypothetical protein
MRNNLSNIIQIIKHKSPGLFIDWFAVISAASMQLPASMFIKRTGYQRICAIEDDTTGDTL